MLITLYKVRYPVPFLLNQTLCNGIIKYPHRIYYPCLHICFSYTSTIISSLSLNKLVIGGGSVTGTVTDLLNVPVWLGFHRFN